MNRDDTYFRLRISEQVKDWVKEQAIANRRSMTAQIAIILENEMKMKKGDVTA